MSVLGSTWQTLQRLPTPSRVRIAASPIFWRTRGDRSFDALRLEDCKRVAVIRLDALGDVVMTSSFLRELRSNLPSARITLIVDKRFANAVETCPYVDEVLTVNVGVGTTDGYLSRLARYLVFSVGKLWKNKYDLALIPRWGADYYDATALAYLSGARWRVGHSETVSPSKARLNGGLDCLLTDIVNSPEVRHEIEQNLGLLRWIGGRVGSSRPEMWLDNDDRRYAGDIFSAEGISRDVPVVGLCPGAAQPDRIWPWQRYAEVARWMVTENGARVVLIGGSAEKEFASEIARSVGPGAIDLTARTTIRQAAAVLARCSIYLGNDTGPMHMAAAVGVPVVAVSCHPQSGSLDHDRSPLRFRPWGVPNRVLQPARPSTGCSDGCIAGVPHCILGVSVEAVIDAVVEVLSSTRHRVASRDEINYAAQIALLRRLSAG